MKINKIRTLLCAAAFLQLGVSGALSAQITITGNGDYRAGSGGEFNVRAADASGASYLAANADLNDYLISNGTVVGTADGTRMNAGFGGQFGFETFCIEYSEHISLPGTYNVAISKGSIYGGAGGGIDHDSNPLTPTTDFISKGTAFLYSHFAKGTLTDALIGLGLGTGYTYLNGAARAADAVQLQNAFWYLEDEISLSAAGGASNPFLAKVFSLYGNPGSGIGNLAGGAKADNPDSSLFHVRALNLGGPSPNQKQDQLVLSSVGFSRVPDGGTTLMLMALSFSSLVFLRRKLA